MIQLNSSITVLIAERTLSVADVLAQSLFRQGYKVVGVVNSGEQAIEYATLRVPDIVLMDLSLSGTMDGLTAAWKIYHELHCPIVYMVATHAEHKLLQQESYLAEVRGTLIKPFSAATLAGTITATLEAYRLKQVGNTLKSIPPLIVRSLPEITPMGTPDQLLLRLLSVASQMQPMPRIFFGAGKLRILTTTTDSARSLSEICRTSALPYPYQIFVWRWRSRKYEPYDNMPDDNMPDDNMPDNEE